VVILGVSFATYQYFFNQTDQHKQASLELITRYHEDDILKARLWLLSNWRFDQLRNISKKTGSAEVVDILAISFIFPNNDVPQTDQLITVIDYLDLVGACINEKVCEPEIARKHLGRDAHSFYCLYQAPIKRMREEYLMDNFGVAIENLLPNERWC